MASKKHKIVVFGSGFVSAPMIDFFLNRPGYHLTVATPEVEKAREMIGDAKNGTVVDWSLEKSELTEKLVDSHELAVSLLPAKLHDNIAIACLTKKRHLVTTSYTTEFVSQVADVVKRAGVVFLNEVGADPGIDHMSAMRVIRNEKAKGGKIESFRSLCGGLPAPESNDNPFGYKFSWNPEGVLIASTQDARFLKDGKEVNIFGTDLFNSHEEISYEGVGSLWHYPNRDSYPYIFKYDLTGAKTMYRGTLRYPQWCETLYYLIKRGYLGGHELNLHDRTYADLTRLHLGIEDLAPQRVAAALEVSPGSEVVSTMDWLGLFEEIPIGLGKATPRRALAKLMSDKMRYQEGERDVIVLDHEFIVNHGKVKEKIKSTLITYGKENGEMAMARTVSLPAALVACLIVEGGFTEPGVHIPVHPEIYEPVLDQLAELDIEFKETRSEV